ncbi:MAG: hypothetical protein CMH22_06090 [Methylophaga sp.]|nr:hypothetical protein [Methylophaga sp.]
MYTLRKITTDNLESNTSLGNSYNVIHREVSYDEFKLHYEAHFNANHVADLDENATKFTKNCLAFISTEEGKLIPIYKNQYNYIMTESGKTFDKIR